MKKKIIQSTLFAFLAILMIAPQAMALEIYVDDYGTIKFYQGEVLGRDDDKENNYNSKKEAKDNNIQRERMEIRESAPIKTIYSSARKQVEFKTKDNGKYKVEVQDSDSISKFEGRLPDKNSFIKKDEIEAQSIDFSFPTDAKLARSTKDRVDYFKERYSQRTDLQSLDKEDRDKAVEKRQNDYKKYLENLQEEKAERTEERVEIRSRSQEGEEKRFEIQSRNIKAKLQGADFSYDSKTGEVILTTPSGQEHFLQHLPDQAITRMTENGFFIDEDQEMEIETTEDGQVTYKSSAKKNKRFLGLFNRQINTEVVLDDLTGEIVETELPSTNFLEELLNNLSF